jgi:hypothetical protein
MNIEPDSLPIDWRPADYSDSFEACPAEFKRRLKISIAHLRNGTLPCTALAFTNALASTIRLTQFASWASELGWQLPPEFPGATPKQTRPESRSAPAGAVTVQSIKHFFMANGKDTEGRLKKAAEDKFAGKHVTRQRVRDAMDELGWRTGATGRPKKSPK